MARLKSRMTSREDGKLKMMQLLLLLLLLLFLELQGTSSFVFWALPVSSLVLKELGQIHLRFCEFEIEIFI